MLLTSRQTAQRLDEADVVHLSRQVEACKLIFPDHKSFTIPIGHGIASFTLPLFGRKLNRIFGFGMGGPVSDEGLTQLEDAYSAMDNDTSISLCPLAHESALQVLSSRGYKADSFVNNYAREISDADLQCVPVPSVEVLRLPASRAYEFPAISLAGFRDNGRPELLLHTLGRMAELREDTILYFALVDGQIAGSAGMALIKTSTGGLAHMYIDSTLPEYRGRGIQTVLLRARLVDARREGYDLASSGCNPGTGSARTYEREGFALSYTKVHFKKIRS